MKEMWVFKKRIWVKLGFFKCGKKTIQSEGFNWIGRVRINIFLILAVPINTFSNNS